MCVPLSLCGAGGDARQAGDDLAQACGHRLPQGTRTCVTPIALMQHRLRLFNPDRTSIAPNQPRLQLLFNPDCTCSTPIALNQPRLHLVPECDLFSSSVYIEPIPDDDDPLSPQPPLLSTRNTVPTSSQCLARPGSNPPSLPLPASLSPLSSPLHFPPYFPPLSLSFCLVPLLRISVLVLVACCIFVGRRRRRT